MTTKITMIPYNRQGEIDYAKLEFDPDKPVAEKPDAMEQRQEQAEIYGLLRARFTEFGQRPDVLLDFDTYICYDRRNLNVRICPDICLVFGVDNEAIRPRRLYLPWEAGKPPTGCLKWLHRLPDGWTSTANRECTPISGSRNTGGSTHRVGAITGNPWPETFWSTESINQWS